MVKRPDLCLFCSASLETACPYEYRSGGTKSAWGEEDQDLSNQVATSRGAHVAGEEVCTGHARLRPVEDRHQGLSDSVMQHRAANKDVCDHGLHLTDCKVGHASIA